MNLVSKNHRLFRSVYENNFDPMAIKFHDQIHIANPEISENRI